MKGFRKSGAVDLRRMPRIVIARIGNQKADGTADQILHTEIGKTAPACNEPVIQIDATLTGRVQMETLLHEAVHLACPWMPEITVTKLARYLAMVVWGFGYRKAKDA